MRKVRRHDGPDAQLRARDRPWRATEPIAERKRSPRELWHSVVSLLSDSGVSIEEISRLVGHSGTTVTELVYRHQIRPVLQTGAVAMDTLFGTGNENP